MSDIDWTEVGERIRERRMALGLSQKDVAEPDYTAAYLSLVESGSRRASQEAIGHIATKLNTDAGYLLHGYPEGLEGRIALALQRARIEVRTGDPDQGRQELMKVLRDTRTYELRLLEAKALEYLASAEELNDLDVAADTYEQALALYADEPAHLRFGAVAGIARVAGIRGQLRYTIHVLEDYLLQLQREGLADPTALMRTYSSLVAAYSRSGLRKEAADAAERALALSSRVNDPEQIGCMNLNVANHLLDLGRVHDALRAVERAEAAFDSLGWRKEVSSCQLNRGIMLTEQGDFERARQCLLDALATQREEGLPAYDLLSILNELAKLERLSGDRAAARAYLDQGERYLEATDGSGRAQHLCESALLLDDPLAKEQGLLAAVELYRTLDTAGQVSATLTLVGDSRRERGDFEGAAEAYRAALEALRTV